MYELCNSKLILKHTLNGFTLDPNIIVFEGLYSLTGSYRKGSL